jgi:hypothetical protein
MSNIHIRARPRTHAFFIFCGAVAISTPALADHLGPSGVGSGGGASVFGPDTLDAGHWAAGLRLTYARPAQRSDAALADLARRGIDAHNTDANMIGSASAAFGINHHLTLSAELPYVRREHLREGTDAGVDRLGSVGGAGDLNLFAKYRLTDGADLGFALIAGIKLPTGSTHHRSRNGERLETEHQPGTGSWDPIVGESASVPMRAITLTASAIYQFSSTGAQRTRLGDRLQGGIALSKRFGSPSAIHAESHSHHHGDELDEHEVPGHSSWDAFIELAGEWEGRQTIGGVVEHDSGGKWGWIAPGLRFNSASGWTVSGALAVPLWQGIRQSHPNNQYRLTLALGRGF